LIALSKVTSNPAKAELKIPKSKRGAWESLAEPPASIPTRTGESAAPSTESIPTGSHSTFNDFHTTESTEDTVMGMEEKRPELESQIEDADMEMNDGHLPIFPAPVTRV
jgi:hypothetical protein